MKESEAMLLRIVYLMNRSTKLTENVLCRALCKHPPKHDLTLSHLCYAVALYIDHYYNQLLLSV